MCGKFAQGEHKKLPEGDETNLKTIFTLVTIL